MRYDVIFVYTKLLARALTRHLAVCIYRNKTSMSKGSHYGPPAGGKSHYGPPPGNSNYGPPKQQASPYGPGAAAAMPTNTQQTVSPNGGATSKSSRFAPLSDSVKRSPDAADVEPTAKRARANRFDGVFTEREAPKSKVVIPQADHPEIDFLGALFSDKDEKKKGN